VVEFKKREQMADLRSLVGSAVAIADRRPIVVYIIPQNRWEKPS
jgi:hypothetical protein